MDVQIDNLLENLNDKLKDTLSLFEKLIKIKQKKLQKKEIELFSKISCDINNLDERVKEFYFLLLDKSNEEKSSEDIISLREMKINNKVQDILLPYMLYIKIILENNYN